MHLMLTLQLLSCRGAATKLWRRALAEAEAMKKWQRGAPKGWPRDNDYGTISTNKEAWPGL